MIIAVSHPVNVQVLQAIGFLLGTVVPVLTALVTRVVAPPGVKAAINALLSAVVGALTAIIGAQAVDWYPMVLTIGTTWVSSIATYYGLLKPTGTAQRLGRATAGFGVGGARQRGV